LISRQCRDDGSALVEFVWLSVLLMIPLVYVVLSALSVQRAAFAVTSAAREGARAYATAGSDEVGETRAEQAIALAMRDQGVTWSAEGRVVDCGDCSYAAGSTFTVRLTTKVALPFVPGWLCGARCVAGITVRAHHSEHIDCFGASPVVGGLAPEC
jgi:hypothetical protein